MDITILATGSFADVARDTPRRSAELAAIFSQVHQLFDRRLSAPALRLQADPRVLEERRRRIEEGLLNAEKIKQEWPEREAFYAEILAKAKRAGQKMIDDARESSALLPSASSRKRSWLRSRSWRKHREASAISTSER